MKEFHVMMTVFPWFQSCLPGGLKYDLNAPMADRIQLAVRAAGILLNKAKETGTNRWGSPMAADNYTPIGLLQRYMEHGTLRSDRKHWKATCMQYHVWSGVDEWSVGVMPTDKKNWDEFRTAMREYISSYERNWVDRPAAVNEEVLATVSKRDTKPDHLHYMTVLFPFFMAHTPGGIHYDMSIPLDERVDRWVIQTRILGDTAAALGVALSGGQRAEEETGSSFASNVERLCVSMNIRQIRNRWKRAMDNMQLDRTDPQWRRPDGREAKWSPEWVRFRDNLQARYSHLFA